jgi:insertion element IS1 protein InsB
LNKDTIYYTDDWDVYSEIIPEGRHKIGKKNTVKIEQNNSNIRHYLGRMTRRTKVVSKSILMIDLSLRIHWFLNEQDGYKIYQNIVLSIY